MQRGLIFWVIMIVWVVFEFAGRGGALGALGAFGSIGGTILELVLFGLLGWQVYGPAIRG